MSKKKEKIIIAFAVIFLFVSISSIFFLKNYCCKENPKVIINNKEINIEIADEPREQVLGLSYRKKLAENNGMLFIFDKKEERNFWMKSMNFPIDIIWINDELIVDIDKNLPPEGENPENLYGPGSPINKVLEVNAGFTDKYNIKIGDKVEFNL